MLVRESISFTRETPSISGLGSQIGIGREKLIGDFVDEMNKISSLSSRPFTLKIEDKNNILSKAVEKGRADIVRLLLSDPDTNPAYKKNSIIALASMAGSEEVVDLLLKDDRVNPADNHNESLYQAAKNNNLAVVRRLMQDTRVNPADAKESLDKDYNIKLEDNYIIQEAAANGYFEVIKELMKDPRVKLKRVVQLVVSKLSKVPQTKAAIDTWSPILDYLLNSSKAQEELSDKEISKIKDKINKL
jgi:ankyrin repeat protein